jgi:hypothetical protein
MKTIDINGVMYWKVPALEGLVCSGCTAAKNFQLCESLNTVNGCLDFNFITKSEIPLYLNIINTRMESIFEKVQTDYISESVRKNYAKEFRRLEECYNGLTEELNKNPRPNIELVLGIVNDTNPCYCSGCLFEHQKCEFDYQETHPLYCRRKEGNFIWKEIK